MTIGLIKDMEAHVLTHINNKEEEIPLAAVETTEKVLTEDSVEATVGAGVEVEVGMRMANGREMKTSKLLMSIMKMKNMKET